jgi:hypothetical protein
MRSLFRTVDTLSSQTTPSRGTQSGLFLGEEVWASETAGCSSATRSTTSPRSTR